MTQMEKIDFLIREYSKENYTTKMFCDQFVSTLYYEKDDSISTKLYSILDDYATTFSRFSPYEEDVKSGILFDEKRIRKTFQELMLYWKTREHQTVD